MRRKRGEKWTPLTDDQRGIAADHYDYAVRVARKCLRRWEITDEQLGAVHFGLVEAVLDHDAASPLKTFIGVVVLRRLAAEGFVSRTRKQRFLNNQDIGPDDALATAVDTTWDRGEGHVSREFDELLPPDMGDTSRHILREVFLNRATKPELAVSLGISPAAVTMRQKRALGHVRTHLGRPSCPPATERLRTVR